MNEHTRRLLDRMRYLLDQYSRKTLSLRSLVDGLELNLNTLEERLPEKFYSDWYTHWGTLEVALAMSVEGLRTEDESRAQVLKAVEALDHLIQTAESPDQ